MDRHYGEKCRPARTRGRRSVIALACVAAILLWVPAAEAQFNSGSSGIHGVFPPIPEGGSVPNTSYIVWNVRTGGVRYCSSYTLANRLDQCDANSATDVFAQIPNIPPGGLTTGVYEFTSVNLVAIAPVHKNVVVAGANPNVPLSILSQGDITIAGNTSGYVTTFYIDGQDGFSTNSNFSVAGATGGPGGFAGGGSGNGGLTPESGVAGTGPAGGAGGQASASTSADLYGASAASSPLNIALTPLVGGSGGGGAAGVPSNHLGCGASALGYAGGGGGGGGGALLLAASGRVTLGTNGSIQAGGGSGGRNTAAGCGLYAGGGTGGSVRIVSQEFVGPGQIVVSGGTRFSGGSAPGGYVRIEAAVNTYSGQITGAAGGSFLSFPTAAIPSTQPALRITSLAGAAAPANPSASIASPDITFQDAITAPVTLSVTATNVPLGTAVNVRVAPAVGQPTTATTNGLSGTVANSTAQATVILPPGAGIVTASATFTVGSSEGGGGSAFNNIPLIDGERPQQVEVVAMADGTSRAYLVARSGARFEWAEVKR